MSETVPEILRTNLTNTLLYLKVLGVSDVLAFDFLDPPSESQILEGLMLLNQLNAIDSDGEVTNIGKLMSNLPLEPCLSRAIVASTKHNCIDEMVTIVAMLSAEKVLVEASKFQRKSAATNPKQQLHLEAMEEAHSRLRSSNGDHMSLLMIFHEWTSLGNSSKSWCDDNFMNFRSLQFASKIRFDHRMIMPYEGLTLLL